MQTYEQTVTAGGVWSLHAAGRFFRIIECSGNAPVDILFFRNGIASGAANAVGAGYWTRPADLFSRIEITSASAQRIKIAIADGDGGYDVVGVTGVVSVADATYQKIIENRCYGARADSIAAVASKSAMYQLWNHVGSGRKIVIKNATIKNGSLATSIVFGATSTQGVTTPGFASQSYAYPGTTSDIQLFYGNVTNTWANRTYRHLSVSANEVVTFESAFPVVLGEGKGFIAYDNNGNSPLWSFYVDWEEVPN